MMTPRGLVGAALLLWGVSVGFLPVAIVLALAYEGARFVSPSAAAMRRVTLVGRFVLFAVLAKLAYAAVSSPFPQALYIWLKWLPILLLPLPLVQALAGGTIATNALPVAMRPNSRESREIDTTYIYTAIVLVGAGTGAAIDAWFFPAAALLIGWALVTRMPANVRVPGAIMLAMGIGMGYAVHVGVRSLQAQVEEWSESLIIDYMTTKADAMRERTRIGDLGKVKLSDRILMRVVPHGAKDMVLLREGAFDRYNNGVWQSSARMYKPVLREGERWLIREGNARRAITIRRSLGGGEGVLALPAGSHVITKLPAATLEMVQTGVVRAVGTPYFLAMSVSYDETRELEAPMMPGDISVPELLEATLDQVIATENLRRATPAESLAAVQALFATKYAYSLSLSDPKEAAKGRTIVDFLLHDRKGHCEYFGTATVLLLRRLGIPARYTVGFSVQEYSDLERAFVVRNRHAHAWSMAFMGGRWIEVDTTPANWATSEAEEARSVFGPVMDAFSWLWDRIVDFWVQHTAGEIALALASIAGGVAAIGAVIVIWLRRRGTPKTACGPSDKLGRAWRSLESRLAKLGVPRARDETPLAWARRIHSNGAEPWRSELLDLARRYYRARFDPEASPAFADELAVAASRWRAR
ncbi:MAG: transglutaminase domain-containing protein [Burkholderiales bacterium]|nr:transglutaminase domain-containing protein [Burkholderiales bacterium]